MKKLINSLATLILFIIPLFSMAQGGDFTVNVTLAGSSSIAKAYLIHNSPGRPVDSAVNINGSFILKGNIDHPIRAVLVINKKGTGLVDHLDHREIVLEPTTIDVNSADSLSNAKITGSKMNDDYTKLMIALAPVNEKMKKMNDDYRSASPDVRDSKPFTDALNKRDSVIEIEKKSIYLDFIKNNPGSFISLFAIKDLEGSEPDIVEAERLFNSLSVNVRSTKSGVTYANFIADKKKTNIGAAAPDFTLTDTSGKAVSLHDFKGKYVLVDFWASWCMPCRAENPNVVKAFAQFHDKGFTVLGVSLDSPNGKASWIKAIKDDHLTWTEVADLKNAHNVVADQYTVESIPQNFLVGPDGKIIAKDLRGDDLQNKLAEILK